MLCESSCRRPVQSGPAAHQLHLCLVLNYARVLEKHEPVRSFQLGKGDLEWFALADLMTIELPLAR